MVAGNEFITVVSPNGKTMLVVHVKQKGSIHMELNRRNAQILGANFSQKSFITLFVRDTDGK